MRPFLLAFLSLIVAMPLTSVYAQAEVSNAALLERIERLEQAQSRATSPIQGARLHGQIMLDGAIYKTDSDVPRSERMNLQDGLAFRRVRMIAEGAVREGVEYELQLQLTGNQVSLLNVYVDFASKIGTIRVGSMKRPESQDAMRSSNDLVFLERSLISDVADRGRAVGVSLSRFILPGWYMTLGAYSGSVESRNADVKSPLSFGGRTSYEAWSNELGALVLSAYGMKYTSEDEPRFRTDLQTRVSRERILDTGKVTDTTKFWTGGLEVAFQWDRFRFVQQYTQVNLLDRASSQNPVGVGETIRGFSSEWGYVLTQDRRGFDTQEGLFKSINPENPWGSGGIGAFEIATRFSYIDMNDGQGTFKLEGGKGQVVSLALNWFPVSALLFSAEVAQGEVKERAGGLKDETLRYVQGRMRLKF